jgi:hypothetical protein
VYLNSFESEKKCARRAHQRNHNSRGASRLLNTLEERNCAEKAQEDRVVEYSVELCQVGIEQVQVCTSELCFEFREKRSVKEKTPQSY